MIVDYLSLNGFLGYSECELEFRGRSTIGIAGPNESGKSSLLRAITYALFGQVPTPQGAVREVQLINDHADSLMVELVVAFPDGTDLHIERGRTSKNEAVLRASGIGKTNSTKVQSHIDELVRVSYEDFIALSYFVQGDMHQFMSGSKRAYFQRWTAGLRQWKGYEDHSSSNVARLESALTRARAELQRAEQRLEREAEFRAEARSARSAAQKAERATKIVDEQVKDLTGRLRASEAGEELKQAYDMLRTQLGQQQRELDAVQVDVRRLKHEVAKVRSGICPLLPDDLECPELQSAGDAKRKEINLRLRDLKKRSEDLARSKQETGEKLDGMQRRLKQSLAPAEKTRGLLAQAKRELNQLNRDLRSALDRKTRAQLALEQLAEARSAADKLKAEIETTSLNHRRWQFMRFMCSRSGVPALLIEGELERVEQRCNWVLERLDYNKRIRFAGYKELATFERVCGVCGSESWRKGLCKDCSTPRPKKRKEEPTVTILDGVHERPFALESGGAQTLHSFAVRLASGLFVSSMTGVSMRMVMLDEVFAHLDSDNRQRLMSLVVDKLATEFGLQQQFVVSHQADVINVVDDMLIVKRERGSSTAQWA